MKTNCRFINLSCTAVLAALVAMASGWAAELGAPPLSTPGAPAQLSLDALVAEALQNNPELRFYETELAVARAGRKSAGLWPSPEISGSAGQKSVRDRGQSSEGLAWSVTVAQPFEWPGRIGLRKAIANHDIELAELGFEKFRVALASRIRLLGYTLFAAQEESAAARDVADRFRSLREVLVQRDPAGLTPLLEFRIIEAGELTMQRKATEATLAQQSALFELNQLRGVPAGTPLVVSDANIDLRQAPSSDVLILLAKTNNFDLRLRAVELAQQGFRVSLAKNERFPTLSVGPTYSEERAGERERVIGVGLSIPIPLWNRNQGNIEAAEARQLQAETLLHLAHRELERQVLEASMAYQSKVRQMTQWRPDSIRHFKEAAELADRHYRLGAVPVATYVELQEKYLEAVESLLTTKKEALEAAQNIELLTGLTPPLTSFSPDQNRGGKE